MAKRKCPACGSTDTVKLLYGMPNQEAYGDEKRREIVLGGCCISPNSPNRACKNCGQRFGGNNSELKNMCSFDFYVGGYFGTSYHVYIDGRREKKWLRYGQTSNGYNLLDLKNEIPSEYYAMEDVVLTEKELSNEQWYNLIDEIAACEVEYWNNNYFNSTILDGTQWHIEIGLPEGHEIYKSGSNEYPPAWKKFIEVLKKYVDERIG